MSCRSLPTVPGGHNAAVRTTRKEGTKRKPPDEMTKVGVLGRAVLVDQFALYPGPAQRRLPLPEPASEWPDARWAGYRFLRWQWI